MKSSNYYQENVLTSEIPISDHRKKPFKWIFKNYLLQFSFSTTCTPWIKLLSQIKMIVYGLMLLRFKDLMNVTEKLQFIDPTFQHSCLVPSSRQECRNVGSMNCNVSVTFIKSSNQSSIKPCLIVHLVAMWTY